MVVGFGRSNMRNKWNVSASCVSAVVVLCACAGGVFDAAAFAQENKTEGAKSKAKSGKPAVFSDLSFEDARKSTEGNEKILIVKATAEWCGPCKQMDKTTWRDEDVVAWVKDNGLAIMVDVDKEEKIARKLSIEAMPTMVAFKDGKEADRIVGYRGPKDFLRWAEDVKAGRTTGVVADEKLKKLRQGGDGEEMGMQERYELARELVQSGKHEDATKEFVWLWKNMAIEEPAMSGVRVSFMVGDMEELASQYAPAKDSFRSLRDETEEKLKGEDKSFEDLSDWIVLNNLLEDQGRTLEWFDRIKERPTASATLSRVEYLMEPILESNGRIADWGKLIRNPVGKVKQAYSMYQMQVGFSSSLKQDGEDEKEAAEHKAEFEKYALDNYRETTVNTYRAMLAAKRDEDAAAVAAEAVKGDDTCEMRVQLVQAAITMGEARGSHNDILNEAMTHEPKDNESPCDKWRIKGMLGEVERQLKAK